MKNEVEFDKNLGRTSEEIKSKALDIMKENQCWATFCIKRGDSETGINMANHGLALDDMLAALCLLISAAPHPGVTKDNFINQVMGGIRNMLDQTIENDG